MMRLLVLLSLSIVAVFASVTPQLGSYHLARLEKWEALIEERIQQRQDEGGSEWPTACEKAFLQAINTTYPDYYFILLASGYGPNQLGMYDECQHSKHLHYVLLVYRTSLIPVDFRTGICVPLVCTENDIKSSIQWFLDEIDLKQPFEVHAARKTLETPNAGAILVFTFLAFLGALVLSGGALEYYLSTQKAKEEEDEESQGLLGEKLAPINDAPKKKPRRQPMWMQILLAFSPINNFSRLIAPSATDMPSLNGLRTMSMLWVLLGHTGFWATFSAGYDNPIYTYQFWFRNWSGAVLYNGPYSVDAFFYMSGFLVGYFAQKELEKKKKINMFLYYFHRVWRLTPPYFVTILILWKCMPYFGNGPWWYQVDDYISRTACDDYWWANLLYINNFVPNDYNKVCMGWSWYLANDMQMYVLTPIFIFAFFYNKIVGWVLLCLATFGSLMSNVAIAWHYEFTPYAPDNQTDDRYESYMYNKFYCRAAVWLVGIGAAWILMAHEKRKDKRIPVYIQVICWIVSLFLIGSVVFGTVPLYQNNGEWPLVRKIMYLSFSRFAFGIGLAIMMHMCITGHGYFVNSLLSLPIWDILARLTYSAYLYHPLLMGIYYFGSTQFFHYSVLVLAMNFIGFSMFSFTAATISFLLIEKPMMNLEKLLLPHGKSEHKK